MKIWVDADACPVAIREMLVRGADRAKTTITFVANQYLRLPTSAYVSMVQVEKGFDIADNYIATQVMKDDLVITQDIPLASEVIDKGALVINTRGEKLTTENVKARLNVRDFMETMRSSGVHTGGPPPLSNKEKQQFANHLDQWLNLAIKKRA